MTRRLLLVAFASLAGCGERVDILATAEDGQFVLTRSQPTQLGCGGVQPTDEPAVLHLRVKTDDGKLRVRLPHSCASGAGELRLSPDRRVLVTRCPGAAEWHVSYLLFGREEFGSKRTPTPVVNLPELVADPGDGWTNLPRLSQTAGVFSRHAELDYILMSIRAHDGGAAHARALADTVESPLGSWQREFDYLAEQDRAPVLAALRKAASKPDPEPLALRRAAASLPEEDRPRILPPLLSLAAQPPTRSAHACDALESLAARRTDDLGPLACALLDRAECRTEVLHVLATTDDVCEPLEPWTTKWVLCDGKACDGRICDADELAARLPEVIRTRHERDIAFKHTILLHAALHRRPESLAAAQFRLNRSGYDLDASVVCSSKDDCPCGDEDFLRSVVCSASASTSHVKPVRCLVEIDDTEGVLRQL